MFLEIFFKISLILTVTFLTFLIIMKIYYTINRKEYMRIFVIKTKQPLWLIIFGLHTIFMIFSWVITVYLWLFSIIF